MIFLSFDIEEFDNPLPYTKTLIFEQQMSISKIGTVRILDLLLEEKVKATFFCTANFAMHATDLIGRMINEGHEVASHGYYHATFEEKDLAESKRILEQLTGTAVVGFRMPNMAPLEALPVVEAGYKYFSSLNPTFLPGKYYNLNKPRRIFYEKGLCQIPASVSKTFRVPLFWLSLHNFPINFYKRMCQGAILKDGYLNIYFHPWEFADLMSPDMKLPSYILRNSGTVLVERLRSLIHYFNRKNYQFGTLKECLTRYPENSH
ncbi:MAG: polysaccharide deacetylase family protein [Prolixibacteraceae bacterium]|nr:polysaccharide deacetylase family protein [Prolixibacteraceae bacterium]